MIGRRSLRGSITVMFALVLVLVAAIFWSTITAAGQAAASYFAAQAQQSSLESCFAGYYRPLWENYHLLYYAEAPNLLKEYQSYLSYYEEPQKETGISGVILCPIRAQESCLTTLHTAMSENGASFLKEMELDMTAHGAEALAEELFSGSQIVKEAGTVADYIQSLGKYADMAGQIESHVSNMKLAGIRLKSQYEALRNGFETEGFWEAGGQELVESARQTAEEILGTLETDQTKVRELTGTLRESAEDEQTRLREKESEVSRQAYVLMQQEFDQLREYGEEDGARLQEAENVKEKTESAADLLLNTEAFEDGRPTEAFRNAVEEGSRLLEDLGEEETVKKKTSSLLTALKDWGEEGILGLVAGTENAFSDQILETENRPSRSGTDAGAETEGSAAESTDPVRAALQKTAAAFYMTEHFSRFGTKLPDTGDMTHVLSYEAEYILGGSDSDRENLLGTAEKLIALRSGMNFLYLLTDQEKNLEAEALAAALVGFTGIYPLISLTAKLILAAWALAEAVTDVRELMAEMGEVPVWKTKADWKLSLQGAEAFFDGAEDLIGDGAEADQKKFWNYDRYLQILFLLENGKTRYFRMMDLIEANLQQKEPAFRMANCVSSAVVETNFKLGSGIFGSRTKSAGYSYQTEGTR